MSPFNRLSDPNDHDLLANNRFVSMPLPSQDQSQEPTGSSSFVAPPATTSFLPSDSAVGGHAQGERNIYRQYHISAPGPAFHGQQRHHPRHHQTLSPPLPITGSVQRYDVTAPILSPAHYLGHFNDTQYGAFDMPTHTDRAFSSSSLRVNQASARREVNRFPVDPTTPRVGNMQHTMHGNVERDRRDEEASLQHPTINVGLGTAHTHSTTHHYGHEQDDWHSCMMVLDGHNPTHMSGTAPPTAFGSLVAGDVSREWYGTPPAATRIDGSDPMLFDESVPIPIWEHYPRTDSRRPQIRPRRSAPTPAIHGSRHPSTSAYDLIRGQTDWTSDGMTYALSGDPPYTGQDNYRIHQQTARQPPLIRNSFLTVPTLNLHDGDRVQDADYGSTAGGTYSPQGVFPNVTASQAPVLSGTLVGERAAGNLDPNLGNTNRRRSATTPRSPKKDSQRKGRTLRPLSNYAKEERAYKRRSGTVCDSCRSRKIKVSTFPPKVTY